MSTAFGILLFLIVYGPVAYLVYKDVHAQRSREQPRVAPSAAHRGTPGLQLRSAA
jgi:hypothetical protein